MRIEDIKHHLASSPWTEDHAQHLWTLLKALHQQDDASYHSTIQPILIEHQTQLAQYPLRTFYKLQQLETASQLVPLPCFGYETQYDALNLQDLQTLANNPLLGFVNALKITGSSDDRPDHRGADVLLQSPHLQQLKQLELRGFDFQERGVEHVVHAEKCRNLRVLGLADCHIDDDGIKHLSKAPFLQTLEHLALWDNQLTANNLDVLNGAQALKILHLNGNAIGAQGIEAIAPLIPQLTTLDLQCCALEDDGLIVLSKVRDLSALENLYLNFNELEDDGLIALAQNATLAPIDFQLSNNRIGDDAITQLASGTALQRIENLVLYDNNIGDAGLTALAKTPCLTLEELSIENNPFGDKGFIALIDHAHHFPTIETLDLRATDITAQSAIHLAKSSFLAQLDGVLLDEENDIDPSGWEALIESPYATEYTVDALREYYDP